MRITRLRSNRSLLLALTMLAGLLFACQSGSRSSTDTKAAAGSSSLAAASKPDSESESQVVTLDFSLAKASGDGNQDLKQFNGTIRVVDFWATWCPPCKDETPSLNKLQKYIESRNGTVLGVSADEDADAYSRFLRTEGVVFPTYRDPSTKGSVSDIARSYGTSVYPETYVIGRDGKIARKFIGFQQWDSPDMLAYFDALLKQS